MLDEYCLGIVPSSLNSSPQTDRQQFVNNLQVHGVRYWRERKRDATPCPTVIKVALTD